MDMALIVLRQVAMLVVYVLLGFFAVKSGKVSNSISPSLSNILLYVITPFLIINSLCVEYKAEKTTGFVVALLLSFVIHGVFILLSHFLFLRKGGENLPVERYAVTMSNTGYIGIPLVAGIFGQEAVFYLVGYVIAFNVCAWSYGMWLLQKGKKLNVIKMIFNPGSIPAMIGLLLYFSQVTMPAFFTEIFGTVAGVNSFLSLFAIGMLCSRINFKEIFRNVRVLYVAACRLILMPTIVFFLLLFWLPYFLPENGGLIAAILAVASMTPSAMALSFMCEISGRDPVYGGNILAVTTVLCVVTVPVLASVFSMLVL